MHKKTKTGQVLVRFDLHFFNRADHQKTGLSGQKPDTWQLNLVHFTVVSTKGQMC